jgi:hypothetical protein
LKEEEALIRGFVLAAKRQRLVDLLANPKRRRTATASLAHFRDLDSRRAVPVRSNEHDAASVERALRARGAGDTCYVVSENQALDGRRMALAAALDEVVGRGLGTLISCVPGVLAYFESEDPSEACILDRRGY